MNKRYSLQYLLFSVFLMNCAYAADEHLFNAILNMNNNIIGLLFRVFNIGMLYCVSAIAMFTLAHAALLAASDGKGFARKLNAWVAIRTIIGAALLIPNPNTGFSYMQDIIFSVMEASVHSAAYLVDNLAVGSSEKLDGYAVSELGREYFTRIVSVSYCVSAYEHRLDVQPKLVVENDTLSYEFEYSDRNEVVHTLKPCEGIQLVKSNNGSDNNYNLNDEKLATITEGMKILLDSVYSVVKYNVEKYQRLIDNEARLMTGDLPYKRVVMAIENIDFGKLCPEGKYCLNVESLEDKFRLFHDIMLNDEPPPPLEKIAFQDIFSLEKMTDKLLSYMNKPSVLKEAKLYILNFVQGDRMPVDDEERKCGTQVYDISLPSENSTVNLSEAQYRCRMRDVIASKASAVLDHSYPWQLNLYTEIDEESPSDARSNVNKIYSKIDPYDKNIGFLENNYNFYTEKSANAHPVERGIARMIKDMIGLIGLEMFDFNKGFNNPIKYMREMGTSILNSGIKFIDDDMMGSNNRSLVHHASSMTTTIYGASSALVMGSYLAIFALDFPIPIGKLHGPRYLAHAAVDIANDSMMLQADKDSYILSALEPLGNQISMVLMIWGGFFGIFLPMVPTLMVIFAFIGWLFLAIEALIASPLIALGLCHPSSQQFFGAAESSLPLILLIYLRPVLIVVSIFLSIIVSYLSLYLLHAGMFGLLGNSQAILSINYSTPGYIDYAKIVSVLLVYSYTAFMVLIQAFSLIGSLPDKVGTWIGQGPLGTQNMVSQVLGVKQGFETTAQSAATGFGQQSKGAAARQSSSGALKDVKGLLSGSDAFGREHGEESRIARSFANLMGNDNTYRPKVSTMRALREEALARGAQIEGYGILPGALKSRLVYENELRSPNDLRQFIDGNGNGLQSGAAQTWLQQQSEPRQDFLDMLNRANNISFLPGFIIDLFPNRGILQDNIAIDPGQQLTLDHFTPAFQQLTNLNELDVGAQNPLDNLQISNADRNVINRAMGHLF